MKDRKQHVIKMAHKLFIDKGFQATSIQDILDYSGIAKGTFYNYFSSKNELLIALFKTVFKQMEKERNELLIGKDPSDIEIFIRQVELHLDMNRTNKLSTLFEEVFVSNDEELKQFIKLGHFRVIRWVHGRFLSIFGEDKKPYLLDCAIMFLGILNHNYKYYVLAQKSPTTMYRVVRYSVDRIVKMVEEVSTSKEQLLPPELLEQWSPSCEKGNKVFQQQVHHSILSLKKKLNNDKELKKFSELLDFIYDELINSKEPRKYLIESTMTFLMGEKATSLKEELGNLEELIGAYFQNKE